MPSIDIDVTNVPDIIEAQLTLSYSRLSDVIRTIVDQGNVHEDDITDIRGLLTKLARENSALRDELQALKEAKGPDQEVVTALGELRSMVAQLSEKVEANAEDIKASAAAREEFTMGLEKQLGEQQTASKATLDRHAGEVDQRLSRTERSLRAVQAFIDLWGGAPEQVSEMGRRNSTQEMEHSLENRTRYVLSLPAFQKMEEEMEVLRALLQRQASDALATKTCEAARLSRKSSYTAAVAAPVDMVDYSGEIKTLTSALRLLEHDVQAVQRERLQPLELAVRELQARANSEKLIRGRDNNVEHLLGQIGQLEGRLNNLLGQAVEAKEDDAGAAKLGMVDLAHRVTLLEETLEGYPHDKHATLATGSLAAGGEVVNADRLAGEAAVRPSSGHSGSTPATGRLPLNGVGSSGILPALTKEVPSSSTSSVNEGGLASRPPRHASSARPSPRTPEVSQPTVDELRLLEASQPRGTSDGRRVSLAVEPDGGLCRRVAQLEENAAILEVNKADRKEVRALEEALRNALEGIHQSHQQHQQALPPHTVSSNSAYSAPPLVPQRPASVGSRGFIPEYAAQQRRAESFTRPHTSAAALGRPMFIGSSTSIYLRDGMRLTNATVSSAPPHQN
ncbi:hypothetical protein JKF63_00571 [Porcisia hertigi]|uniref:Uncharacterized protein n=1 Tax=Porcisia hertigi TaxID=2761500 RepID=A0A836I564_9TRYP|nr:hypothetical protein JKF63_00571 [Porcisia hertigi]